MLIIDDLRWRNILEQLNRPQDILEIIAGIFPLLSRSNFIKSQRAPDDRWTGPVLLL